MTIHFERETKKKKQKTAIKKRVVKDRKNAQSRKGERRLASIKFVAPSHDAVE